MVDWVVWGAFADVLRMYVCASMESRRRICQFALSRDIKKKGIFICSEVEPLSFPHTSLSVLGDESRQTVWSAHILTCKSIDFFLSLFPSLSPSFQYYSICSTQAESSSKGNIFLLFMRNVFRCWTIDIVLAFQVEEMFSGDDECHPLWN